MQPTTTPKLKMAFFKVSHNFPKRIKTVYELHIWDWEILEYIHIKLILKNVLSKVTFETHNFSLILYYRSDLVLLKAETLFLLYESTSKAFQNPT